MLSVGLWANRSQKQRLHMDRPEARHLLQPPQPPREVLLIRRLPTPVTHDHGRCLHNGIVVHRQNERNSRWYRVAGSCQLLVAERSSNKNIVVSTTCDRTWQFALWPFSVVLSRHKSTNPHAEHPTRS